MLGSISKMVVTPGTLSSVSSVTSLGNTVAPVETKFFHLVLFTVARSREVGLILNCYIAILSLLL